MFRTADMDAQHKLLSEISRLVDVGMLKSTLTECWSPINAASLRKGHKLLESGLTRGKITLEGWD
jgi:hypothetical protein